MKKTRLRRGCQIELKMSADNFLISFATAKVIQIMRHCIFCIFCTFLIFNILKIYSQYELMLQYLQIYKIHLHWLTLQIIKEWNAYLKNFDIYFKFGAVIKAKQNAKCISNVWSWSEDHWFERENWYLETRTGREK